MAHVEGGTRTRATPQIAREVAERAARRLAADPRVMLVYLFGSAVQPDRDAIGDIDLAVLATPPFSFEELLRLRADLAAAAGQPIDLISLDEAPIVLAHEVAETGVCLYARNEDVETEFVTRARARYWDFRPFREEQWRLAGERAAARRRGPTA